MAILDSNGTTASKTSECIPLPDQVFTWIQHLDVDGDLSMSDESDDSDSSSETSTAGSSASSSARSASVATSSRSTRSDSDPDTDISAVLLGPGTPLHYTLEAALYISSKIENGELTPELQEDYWHHFDMALRENGEELGKLFHYGRTVCGAVSEAIAKARIVIADMERLSMGEEAALLVAAVEESSLVQGVFLYLGPTQLMHRTLCARQYANRLESLACRFAWAVDSGCGGSMGAQEFHEAWQKIRQVNDV